MTIRGSQIGNASASEASIPKRPKIFYGWYIVGAAAVNGLTNFAIFSIGQALFVKDVRDSFHWSLTAISLGFSIRTLEQGLLSPVGGFMIDRFGPRVMAISGSVVMTLGLLNFVFMHHLWQFYLSSVTIALGQGLGAGQAYINPVVFWFNRKRGRASAVIAMVRGWAYVAVLPMSLLLVQFGWRKAAFFAAIAYLILSIPCALVLRPRPEPYGFLPDGDPPRTNPGVEAGAKSQAPEAEGFGVREAVRTRAFWMLLIGTTIYGYGSSSYQVHFLSHLRFTGFSTSTAGLIFSVYGIIQVISRLVTGWAGDRFGRTNMMIVSQLMMGAGWVAMAFITPATFWFTVPFFYICYGLGQAAYIVGQQVIVADYFGPRRFASIRGLMSPISVIGSIFGPIVAGFSYDHFETYRPAFLILAPLIALGALTLKLAGKPKMARRA